MGVVDWRFKDAILAFRKMVRRSPLDGRPFRWHSDTGGMMHAAEGPEPARGDARMYTMRTLCGRHEIPPNSAWASAEPLGCPTCAVMEFIDVRALEEQASTRIAAFLKKHSPSNDG